MHPCPHCKRRTPDEFRYCQRCREQAKARQATYRLAHPGRTKEIVARYRARNPGNAAAASRRWRQRQDPEYLKAYRLESKSRSRAIAAGNREGVHHTYDEWMRLLEERNYRCAYCQREMTKASAVRDHVVPLSRGGSDGIANIAPSCRSCNSRKRNMLPEEFIQYLAHR